MRVRNRLAEHRLAVSGVHDFDVCPTRGKGFHLNVAAPEAYEGRPGGVANQRLGGVLRDGAGRRQAQLCLLYTSRCV